MAQADPVPSPTSHTDYRLPPLAMEPVLSVPASRDEANAAGGPSTTTATAPLPSRLHASGTSSALPFYPSPIASSLGPQSRYLSLNDYQRPLVSQPDQEEDVDEIESESELSAAEDELNNPAGQDSTQPASSHPSANKKIRLDDPTSGRSSPKGQPKHSRAALVCTECRRRKIRCLESPEGGRCLRCTGRNKECVFDEDWNKDGDGWAKTGAGGNGGGRAPKNKLVDQVAGPSASPSPSHASTSSSSMSALSVLANMSSAVDATSDQDIKMAPPALVFPSATATASTSTAPIPTKPAAKGKAKAKPTDSQPPKKRVRDPNQPSPPPRNVQACETCRARKIRCGGVGDQGEPCAYCVKSGVKCELSSTPSTDRAAASRRRKFESERLAAQSAVPAPVSVPAPAATSIPAGPSRASRPSSIASSSKISPSAPKAPVKKEPRPSPAKKMKLAASPPASTSRALVRTGTFWLFFSHTPGVVRAGGVPGGMDLGGKDRRKGMMLLSRFDGGGGHVAYCELAWIDQGSMEDATDQDSSARSIFELKREIICISAIPESTRPTTAIYAPLAKFTFDLTGEDSTLISITSFPTPASPSPEPFLQALLNASPIPATSSPVVIRLSSADEAKPSATVEGGETSKLEGELKSFWLLGVGPVEGEPLKKEEEVLIGLGAWMSGGKMTVG